MPPSLRRNTGPTFSEHANRRKRRRPRALRQRKLPPKRRARPDRFQCSSAVKLSGFTCASRSGRFLTLLWTIQDPDQPIGTHIFTALNYIDAGQDVRWNVVSMSSRTEHDRDSEAPRRTGYPGFEFTPESPRGARSALERIAIPRETLDRVSELISPGSSLIISDEGASSETGNHTDFVVLMSGEPQGGIIRRRHHNPDSSYRYFRPYGSFWRW